MSTGQDRWTSPVRFPIPVSSRQVGAVFRYRGRTSTDFFDRQGSADRAVPFELGRFLAVSHIICTSTYKLEQAVDMGTGAVVAVTVQTMDGGDTTSLLVTLKEAERGLDRRGLEVREVVADKRYRSNATMVGVKKRGLRGYLSELDRRRRNWKKNREAQKPAHASRRRIRGKRLLRRRREKVERGFAHFVESGALRAVSTFAAKRRSTGESCFRLPPSTAGS